MALGIEGFFAISSFELELVLKLVASLCLGAVIGLEREIHERPAGFRTHALVCMGSTLFTIVSMGVIGPNVDVSRIAAGVVMGIGFLGAGTIFRDNNAKISGLTTAADLWVLAAIGLAVGIGLYWLALISTVLILTVLWTGRFLESKLKTKKESD